MPKLSTKRGQVDPYEFPKVWKEMLKEYKKSLIEKGLYIQPQA